MKAESSSACCVKGWVNGRVQGVGFRYYVSQQANKLGIKGYARNLADGRVEFLLQGEKVAVDRLLDHIRIGPTCSKVIAVSTEQVEIPESFTDFRTG